MAQMKIYDENLGEWISIDGNVSSKIIDLTTATSDYMLQVGETATLTYTLATSVMLHVATVEGLYELEILGEFDGSTTNTNYATLGPNNTIVAAGAIDDNYNYTLFDTTSTDSGATATFKKNGASATGFIVGDALVLRSISKLSTITKCKTFVTKYVRRDSATIYYEINRLSVWADILTAWSSLGTITFPFAQSGKIVIRRII